MKRFNLEEYLKNPERKVVRRDGKDVRIVCTDAKREYYPVLALVDDGCYESPVSYTKNGECFLGQENYCDLFFAPKKHEGWINIFKGAFINAKAFLGQSYIYSSEEIAKSEGRKCNNYLTTIKIEWEE